MTTPTQDEMDRQEFEVYAATREYPDIETVLRRDNDGSYLYLESDWQYYQAALKHQREASAKELAESQAREAKMRLKLKQASAHISDWWVNFGEGGSKLPPAKSAQLLDDIQKVLSETKDHSALDSAINKAVENVLREAASDLTSHIYHHDGMGEREELFYETLLAASKHILALIHKPEKG